MKLNLLMKALSHCIVYGGSDFDLLEKEDLLKALEECSAIKERFEFDDDYHNYVTLLSYSTCTDILNTMTYDIIGRLLRIHDSDMRFEYYAHEARKQAFGLEQFTNEQLQLGYYYLYDLWHDNERNGDNAADGTFRKNTIELTEDTRTAIHNLVDMALEQYNVSHGELDYADLGDRSAGVLYKILDLLDNCATP